MKKIKANTEIMKKEKLNLEVEQIELKKKFKKEISALKTKSKQTESKLREMVNQFELAAKDHNSSSSATSDQISDL